MPKSLLLKNNKKAIEVSLVTLLEIVLAIGIVLVLIYLSLKLSGFIFGRQEYDSVLNNLEALSIRVKELAKDKRNIASQTMVYSISDNFILVGFSYDDKGTMRTECTNENIVTSRQNNCKAKSCLCIYKNHGGVTDWKGKDFDSFDPKGTVPIKCKPFDEKIVFIGQAVDANYKGASSSWTTSNSGWTSHNYLALYGKCGNPLRPSWGLRQIIIDKYKENENTFIRISETGKKV